MSVSNVVIVRQSRHATFRALTADRPIVICVRSGKKVIRHGAETVVLEKGMLGVLTARLPLTIENHPAQGVGYVASVLLPDPDVIADMLRHGLPAGDPFSATRDDRALAAFERAVSAVEDPLLPEPLREHAIKEVILWLSEMGIGFGPSLPVSFKDRLRDVIHAEPDADWRMIDAARILAVSEATLRRRLDREGTTFTDVLTDVRMTYALGLLQTTELSIHMIALSVGYTSQSRFAERFRARFGILPSALRTASDAKPYSDLPNRH
jgi:AraC-like DNA-binding protein